MVHQWSSARLRRCAVRGGRRCGPQGVAPRLLPLLATAAAQTSAQRLRHPVLLLGRSLRGADLVAGEEDRVLRHVAPWHRCGFAPYCTNGYIRGSRATPSGRAAGQGVWSLAWANALWVRRLRTRLVKIALTGTNQVFRPTRPARMMSSSHSSGLTVESEEAGASPGGGTPWRLLSTGPVQRASSGSASCSSGRLSWPLGWSAGHICTTWSSSGTPTRPLVTPRMCCATGCWPCRLRAALAGGLWLTRRRPLIAQAAGVAAVLGLLLVPATGLHDQIDARLAATGQHHHLDAALAPAGQSHEAGGLLSLLEHGGRDALVAQVVALPLALMVLGRRGRRRPARGRRVGWWPREVALASVSLLVLTGAGSTGNAVAAADTAAVHQFVLTDNPGNWFDAGVAIAGTRSLLVVAPGDTVSFTVAPPDSQELHTATSLLWPTGAQNMPFTQPKAFRGTVETQLITPGLYVFLCKLHPFMLGATIVDDPATPELDLGKTVTLANGATIPTASDLALRLVRAFFVITNPANYQKYSATSATTWDPTYPPVPVLAGDQHGNPVSVGNLDAFLGGYFHEPVTLPKATAPSHRGVGEVWVDTQYEMTAHKTKPGTATAVDTGTWKVTKKVALPKLNFNN